MSIDRNRCLVFRMLFTSLKFGSPPSFPHRDLFGISHATALIFNLWWLVLEMFPNESGEKLPAAARINSW